jgi:hypothetical protein
MKHGAASMPTNKQRMLTNLPDSEYIGLCALAEKHNLSMEWIGRKAIFDFLEWYRENLLQLPFTFAESNAGIRRNG